jgi:hypothetical protein
MKMSDELKPCPFCGSKNHPFHKKDCFLIDAYYSGHMAAYNTRPIEDELREEIDRLKAILETYQEES